MLDLADALGVVELASETVILELQANEAPCFGVLMIAHPLLFQFRLRLLHRLLLPHQMAARYLNPVDYHL